MRYGPVDQQMARWSPSEYAWYCTRHDHKVFLLDGSILDKSESWASRKKAEDIKTMNRHLSDLLGGKDSDKGEEEKNPAGESPTGLTQGPKT